MNINDLVRQSKEAGLPNGIDTSLSMVEQFKRAQQKVDENPAESAHMQVNNEDILNQALNKAKAGEPPLDSFQG